MAKLTFAPRTSASETGNMPHVDESFVDIESDSEQTPDIQNKKPGEAQQNEKLQNDVESQEDDNTAGQAPLKGSASQEITAEEKSTSEATVKFPTPSEPILDFSNTGKILPVGKYSTIPTIYISAPNGFTHLPRDDAYVGNSLLSLASVPKKRRRTSPAASTPIPTEEIKTRTFINRSIFGFNILVTKPKKEKDNSKTTLSSSDATAWSKFGRARVSYGIAWLQTERVLIFRGIAWIVLINLFPKAAIPLGAALYLLSKLDINMVECYKVLIILTTVIFLDYYIRQMGKPGETGIPEQVKKPLPTVKARQSEKSAWELYLEKIAALK